MADLDTKRKQGLITRSDFDRAFDNAHRTRQHGRAAVLGVLAAAWSAGKGVQDQVEASLVNFATPSCCIDALPGENGRCEECGGDCDMDNVAVAMALETVAGYVLLSAQNWRRSR